MKMTRYCKVDNRRMILGSGAGSRGTVSAGAGSGVSVVRWGWCVVAVVLAVRPGAGWCVGG